MLLNQIRAPPVGKNIHGFVSAHCTSTFRVPDRWRKISKSNRLEKSWFFFQFSDHFFLDVFIFHNGDPAVLSWKKWTSPRPRSWRKRCVGIRCVSPGRITLLLRSSPWGTFRFWLRCCENEMIFHPFSIERCARKSETRGIGIVDFFHGIILSSSSSQPLLHQLSQSNSIYSPSQRNFAPTPDSQNLSQNSL